MAPNEDVKSPDPYGAGPVQLAGPAIMGTDGSGPEALSRLRAERE